MQLLDERWHREIGKPVQDGLVEITQDQDRSCYEAIFLAPDGTVWRKRYWYKSSMGPAGEVWFRLIVERRFSATRGFTKAEIAGDLINNVLTNFDESCSDSDLSDENQVYLVWWISERITDEMAQGWVEEHEANALNVLGEDYGTDTYLDNENEIDEALSVAVGFRAYAEWAEYEDQ